MKENTEPPINLPTIACRFGTKQVVMFVCVSCLGSLYLYCVQSTCMHSISPSLPPRTRQPLGSGLLLSVSTLFCASLRAADDQTDLTMTVIFGRSKGQLLGHNLLTFYEIYAHFFQYTNYTVPHSLSAKPTLLENDLDEVFVMVSKIRFEQKRPSCVVQNIYSFYYYYYLHTNNTEALNLYF